MNTHFADFLDSIPKDTTRQTYHAALVNFGRFLESKGVSKDTPPSIYSERILLDFFIWLNRLKYSSFTLNTYLAALGQLLLFHHLARNLSADFDILRAQALVKGKAKVKYPMVHPPADLPRLVNYYDRLPLPGLPQAAICLFRDRAIMHTLYATAGRVSEVASLTRQAVAEGQADEVLIVGKGDKERWLYLTPEALAAIRAYLAWREDSAAGLFVSHGRQISKQFSRTSIWRVVNKAAQALDMPEVSPHTFRHWRATQMLNDDVPLEIIQDLLGHSDIGTTRRVYAHTRRGRVREAFFKCSPDPAEWGA